MTEAIKKILKSKGVIICPNCDGTGDVDSFCGYFSIESCYMCQGNGIVKSLKKQKHKKTCTVCEGIGGEGCCDNKGYQTWESYELI